MKTAEESEREGEVERHSCTSVRTPCSPSVLFAPSADVEDNTDKLVPGSQILFVCLAPLCLSTMTTPEGAISRAPNSTRSRQAATSVEREP